MATFFSCLSSNPIKPNPLLEKNVLSFSTSPQILSLSPSFPHFSLRKLTRLLCSTLPTVSNATSTHYEFTDGASEVEVRLELGDLEVSSRDISLDSDEDSLAIRLQHSGTCRTLMDTSCLYGKIKPNETIWYLDDDQLVVNLKKQDSEMNWPDIVESWESLTVGVKQLLKGTSIYLVGESTEINQRIARELAVGLGYTPLDTEELLETFTKQTIDSWVVTEGSSAVAESESAIIESLSSQARIVVATLGGKHGAARRANKWRHLFTGFSVWLSQSEATGSLVHHLVNSIIGELVPVLFETGKWKKQKRMKKFFSILQDISHEMYDFADEDSARDEARNNFQDGHHGYSNAEVIVKIGGWDATYSKTVAQSALSALKRLILADKKLPGKKSLYVRLGCRGDWPDIKPPGWDPSATDEASYSQ